MLRLISVLSVLHAYYCIYYGPHYYAYFQTRFFGDNSVGACCFQPGTFKYNVLDHTNCSVLKNIVHIYVHIW